MSYGEITSFMYKHKDSNPEICPKCGSLSTTFSPQVSAGTSIYQNGTCQDCKVVWTDSYELKYVNFSKPTIKETNG